MAERPFSENLAYWFFRLNGCFTLVDFILHPARSGGQETEADILAVRFPHRQELAFSGLPLRDHELFTEPGGHIDLVFGEVKTGRCGLNRAWIEPQRRAIHRSLDAVGVFTQAEVQTVADALYEDHIFENGIVRVRKVLVGREIDTDMPPAIVQLTWNQVLDFIHGRFTEHARRKGDHQQWDACGQYLFRQVNAHPDATDFAIQLLKRIAITS